MRAASFIVLAASLHLGACASVPSAEADAAFRAWEAEFVDGLMSNYPDWAIEEGDYRKAATLVVPDARDRDAELAFLAREQEALERFDADDLSPALRADHAQIANFLAAQRWRLTTLREWSWNPAAYNVANGIALLLNTEYAPVETRLRAVLSRLEQVPAYYAAARANLDRPTREHTELAIAQNTGALEVFGTDLRRTIDRSALSADEKRLFAHRIGAARQSIQEYVAALKELADGLTPDYARGFRLGGELYAQKFAYEIQSSYTPEELHARALAAKATLHRDMEARARALWPKYFGRTPAPADGLAAIAAVIERISASHSRPERFVDDVRRQIPQLEAFVREKDLLFQDPKKPLVVRETPPYNPVRGVAIASIEAPGPFDPGAATYYNVNPMSDFSRERAEGFLREYNDWMLQILNIHEAVPGHYTQLLHANRSPSVVKSLLSSGPMVEGWAVYAQRMMLENGWGKDSPELWMMLDKFDLRTVCNTILDYSVHVKGMTEEQGLQLLMGEAFQTETEARGKWRRVQLSQVQLTSYFAGYAEIYEFREAEKARLGEKFNLRDFHNTFLSFGSVPVKTIKELMAAP